MRDFFNILEAMIPSSDRKYGGALKVNGFWGAGDGHFVVVTPIEGKQDIPCKSIDRSFTLKYTGEEVSIRLSARALEKAYNAVCELKERSCPECHGTGHVTFSYEAESNGMTYTIDDTCPICMGNGVVDNSDHEFSADAVVTIAGYCYSARVIQNMLRFLRAAEEDSLTIVRHDDDIFTIAEAAGCTIWFTHLGRGATLPNKIIVVETEKKDQ